MSKNLILKNPLYRKKEKSTNYKQCEINILNRIDKISEGKYINILKRIKKINKVLKNKLIT